MSERSIVERLDDLVDASLAGTEVRIEEELAPLTGLVRALVALPRPAFRARLRADLDREATMTMTTDSVSAVRQTAAARLRVKNAAAAIEFYKKAFGMQETMRFEAHGTIAHAELAIGNSIVMIGEEAPEYGYPGPEALGGSPVGMHLYVPDADALVAQAVAAGARIVMPVAEQFYGDRSGQVADPFGYSWTIATRTREMSVEEMQRRMQEMEQAQGPRTAPSFIREGFHTVTPYLVVQDAPSLLDFIARAFDGVELHRSAGGSGGGVHGEIRVGDSIIMVGGGAPELSWRGEPMPTALHVYVPDVDAVYARAIAAGATSFGEPADQAYGERGGGVRDRFGNTWYIATAKGDRHVPPGLHAVNVYLHPRRAEPVIAFLKRAFGGGDIEKYASPDGVVHHAKVTIGNSAIELGEATGPYQPMPTMFYVYVESVDAAHHRAVAAGAESISAPADQPYGDRTAAVKDVFGNTWYLATHLGRP